MAIVAHACPDEEPDPGNTSLGVSSRWSPMAQKALDGWVNWVSVDDGPRDLRGSVLLEDTISEPVEGVLSVIAQLAAGVNAEDASSDATLKVVEVRYGLPMHALRIETVRENPTQIRVTLTPNCQAITNLYARSVRRISDAEFAAALAGHVARELTGADHEAVEALTDGGDR